MVISRSLRKRGETLRRDMESNFIIEGGMSDGIKSDYPWRG